MNQPALAILALLLTLAPLSGARPCRAQSDYPLLEEYSFELSQESGFELSFHDRNLGPGAAQLRLELSQLEPARFSLRLEVFRHVSPGELTFALLLDRVEIDLLGPRDSLLRRVVLDAELGPNGLFTIGDSAGGHFETEKVLERMNGLRGIHVRLFGNYE